MIQVGSTVTWVNKDPVVHTSTEGPGPQPSDPVWDSPKLGLGQQFSFTFNEAGEFQYFCIPHPTFMVATITVVEAGSSNAPLLSGS